MEATEATVDATAVADPELMLPAHMLLTLSADLSG